MSRRTWKIDEPVEFRLLNRKGEIEYVVTAHVAETGLIWTTMARPTGSTAHSLENLQMTLPRPRKAVEGWQFELEAALESGLYRVGEIR